MSDSNVSAAAIVCTICAGPLRYVAQSECNHVFCHLCRLRCWILYQSKICPLCKKDSCELVVSDQPSKSFETLRKQACPVAQAKSVFGTTTAVLSEVQQLLSFNCPFDRCNGAFKEKQGLALHVKKAHKRAFCQICVDYGKFFSRELSVYTEQELRMHLVGKEEGFNGHPECAYCRIHFYSGDELQQHCRQVHHRCEICDKQPASRLAGTVYENLGALQDHFKGAHFLCNKQECLENKFIVFATEAELKYHNNECHRVPGQQRSEKRRENALSANYFFADIIRGTPQVTSLANTRETPSPEGGRSASPEPRALDEVVAQFGQLKICDSHDYRIANIEQLKQELNSEPIFEKFSKMFVQFVQGHLTADRYIKAIANAIPADRVQRIVMLISGLDGSAQQRAALLASLRDFVHRTIEFPALPSSGWEESNEDLRRSGYAASTSNEAKRPGGGASRVLRLGSDGKVVSSQPPASLKQPLFLQSSAPQQAQAPVRAAGDVHSRGRSRDFVKFAKKETHPASISQSSCRKQLDPNEFPELPSMSMQQVISGDLDAIHSSAFDQDSLTDEADSLGNDGSGSFTIGGVVSTAAFSTAQPAATPSKKQKKVVLFRF